MCTLVLPSDRQGLSSIPACSEHWYCPPCVPRFPHPHMDAEAKARGGVQPHIQQAAGLYLGYFGRKTI